MNSIRRRPAILGLAALLLAVFSAPAPAAEKLKLLIIDGQNNHNWKAMTPPMRASLEATGRFQVDVATTPDKNAPKDAWDSFRPDFTKYDAVLSNYNGQAWPDRVQRALEEYVKAGGGLVVVHAANNAFEGWPEWNKMIGLGWRGNNFGERVYYEKGELHHAAKGEGPGAGHGPQHAYEITVIDKGHPVTHGMPSEWLHARDELYHGQRGPVGPMQVLAVAYSDKAKGGTGVSEPMIWVIPYGKGRVFTTVLGHVGGADDPAIKCVGFQTVVARGAEWAATGKVTLPIPANFPTAEKENLAK